MSNEADYGLWIAVLQLVTAIALLVLLGWQQWGH